MRNFSYLAIVTMMFCIALMSCDKQEELMFTVSFNSFAGSEVEQQIVKKGEKLVRPDNPTLYEVGGNDAKISPYVRNANSGSQELMESLVMKDLDIAKLPVAPLEMIVWTMGGAFDIVMQDVNSICYTVLYYKEQIYRVTNIKSIAVNGINPDKASIGNNSYPYVAEVYAAIRSDLDKSSMAYKLYELLQTQEGKRVISESGYLPY